MVIRDSFCYFCTIGHRNEYSTKQLQTMSRQPNYASTLPGKTKNGTKTANSLLHAVRSVEPNVPNFRRKSFNVRFFPYLLENSFTCLLAKFFLHSRGFMKKILQTPYSSF